MVKRQGYLFAGNECILEALLSVVVIEVTGVTCTHHITGGVELPEIRVTICNHLQETDPSCKLESEEDRWDSKCESLHVIRRVAIDSAAARHPVCREAFT